MTEAELKAIDFVVEQGADSLLDNAPVMELITTMFELSKGDSTPAHIHLDFSLTTSIYFQRLGKITCSVYLSNEYSVPAHAPEIVSILADYRVDATVFCEYVTVDSFSLRDSDVEKISKALSRFGTVEVLYYELKMTYDRN